MLGLPQGEAVLRVLRLGLACTSEASFAMDWAMQPTDVVTAKPSTAGSAGLALNAARDFSLSSKECAPSGVFNRGAFRTRKERPYKALQGLIRALMTL